MKNKYGISLIVLIVTIIIMIIIAGAIIISLTNTNIIDQAETAVKIHNIAAEKEQLTLAFSNYQLQKRTSENPKNLRDSFKDDLAEVARVIGGANGPLKVTFKDTNNCYTVYENGNITGPKKGVDSALEEYILGTSGEGVEVSKIFDGSEFINTNLDIELLTGTENTASISNGIYAEFIYIKYNDNEYYKFNVKTDETLTNFYTDPEFGIEFIDKIDDSTRIGKQVEYAGLLWTILYDDEINGIQMISNESLTDLDGNKISIGSDDLTTCISSYNNTVTTLNTVCNSLIPSAPGVIKNIRCIGSNPTSPNSENKTLYTSTKFDIMGGEIETLNTKLYSSDDHYNLDIDQLIITNLATPTNIASKDDKEYWLASKFMYFYDDPSTGETTKFVAGPMYSDKGSIGISDILSAYVENGNKYLESSAGSYYIRPVITLESNIIDELEGDGTTTTPYELDKYYESILIVTETANSIANGTYYAYGINEQTTKLIINDSSNQLCYEGSCNDATITINNGAITLLTTINENEYTFNGNYYETKQNKIFTLGSGDFETIEHQGAGTKNGRLGFIMALNTKDLKHDIEGVYSPSGGNAGQFTLTFTKNSLYALFAFNTNPNAGSFAYAGFKDMFYLNNCQIKYTGLEDGFGWSDPQASGVYYKVN